MLEDSRITIRHLGMTGASIIWSHLLGNESTWRTGSSAAVVVGTLTSHTTMPSDFEPEFEIYSANQISRQPLPRVQVRVVK